LVILAILKALYIEEYYLIKNVGYENFKDYNPIPVDETEKFIEEKSKNMIKQGLKYKQIGPTKKDINIKKIHFLFSNYSKINFEKLNNNNEISYSVISDIANGINTSIDLSDSKYSNIIKKIIVSHGESSNLIKGFFINGYPAEKI